MTLELITFDLDDTLWDIAPVILNAEAALRAWLARETPRLATLPVEHLAEIRSRLVAADPALKHRISELRRRVLYTALIEAGYSAHDASTLAEAAFEVFLAARHNIELYPEAQPALEQLANRFRLAVLTNGNADVRRLGLADYFEFALCAEDVGIGKPDPHPFQELLRRANVRPENAVHVGDNPVDDVAGAQAAGMGTVWFNPAGNAWGSGPPPDAVIGSLADLPNALKRWA
ncbi:HAD family hydrolase [Pseudomonas matsuisoli]|uniref:Haloacid dehalogenase n=1 Tax=Pseudomonas matsuisoli TaxID=1515666 RepID=A0A917Q069_9PSED|nr:HAD-IA family hydrolase [Pseudomonas matsuisoli]GGK03710.1 haloacid dehalogenase [Pseudomonas matsuisoli]